MVMKKKKGAYLCSKNKTNEPADKQLKRWLQSDSGWSCLQAPGEQDDNERGP
jgi:hypothetical protein